MSTCRQDSESVEAQLQLQAEAAKWQRESSQLGESLREAQAGREQAEEHLERLQGTLRGLQRHNQDRGNYDELQARFKEVNIQPVSCFQFGSNILRCTFVALYLIESALYSATALQLAVSSMHTAAASSCSMTM